MMKTIVTDDETNLVTRVAHKVTTVQLIIKTEKIISVFELEGAHIPANLSSKNAFRLKCHDASNGTD
jgi:hypothetical protein